MDREAIFSVLLASINEFGGLAYTSGDIDRSRPVFDYGVDSLNVMLILAEMEERLGVEIDLGTLSESEIASVDSLLDYLEALHEWAPESA